MLLVLEFLLTTTGPNAMLLQLPAPPELANTAIRQPESPASSDSNFMFIFILLYLLSMQMEYKVFLSLGSKLS